MVFICHESTKQLYIIYCPLLLFMLNFGLSMWNDYQSIQMNKFISELYQYLKWRKTRSGKNTCFANGICNN